MKVQAESRVPQLKKEVTEAMRKLAKLAKERNVLANQAKMVPKLEAEVEGLCAAHKLKVEKLCSSYSTELELKDSFCETEKIRLLTELQANYKSKLTGLYDE